ncbi:MAG: response regulator [Thermodesulfobacteriota bacterium]
MARILVLDDVADSARMIRKILEKKGHEVLVFSDEDEALRYAAGHPLDLAILDVKLRKLDGTEVLAELRKLQPGLAAIMLTGFPTKSGAQQALRLGAAAYCAKPIEKQALEETVAAILSRPRT